MKSCWSGGQLVAVNRFVFCLVLSLFDGGRDATPLPNVVAAQMTDVHPCPREVELSPRSVLRYCPREETFRVGRNVGKRSCRLGREVLGALMRVASYGEYQEKQVKSARSWAKTIDLVFFFQAEDGIRDLTVTGVQTCALPI